MLVISMWSSCLCCTYSVGPPLQISTSAPVPAPQSVASTRTAPMTKDPTVVNVRRGTSALQTTARTVNVSAHSSPRKDFEISFYSYLFIQIWVGHLPQYFSNCNSIIFIEANTVKLELVPIFSCVLLMYMSLYPNAVSPAHSHCLPYPVVDVPVCGNDTCGDNAMCVDSFTEEGPHCLCHTGYHSDQDPIHNCTGKEGMRLELSGRWEAATRLSSESCAAMGLKGLRYVVIVRQCRGYWYHMS